MRWTLACPCLPVLEVDMSMICGASSMPHGPGRESKGSSSAPALGSPSCARAVRSPRRASPRRASRARGTSREARNGALRRLDSSRAHLAGVALDDNVSALAEGRALLGVGEGRAGRDGLERLLVLLVVVLRRREDGQLLRVATAGPVIRASGHDLRPVRENGTLEVSALGIRSGDWRHALQFRRQTC